MTNYNRNITDTSPSNGTFLHLNRLVISQLYFSISVGSLTLTLFEQYPEYFTLTTPTYSPHIIMRSYRKSHPREKIV